MKTLYRNEQHFSLREALLKLCANRLQAESANLIQRRGGKLVIYANDTIGNAIAASGFYEWTELQTVFNFLSPLHEIFRHSIALDVGANIGNHSVYFSRYFEEVHAFEPHPVTSRILEVNASQYPGITVHCYGLSDKEGINHLTENPVNLGGSRITPRSNQSITINLQTLDNLAFDKNKLALIKLDVEGHEANVLRGGAKTIQQSMPIVLFEAHFEDFKKPMDEVLLLASLGYRFAWIQPLGTGIKKYFRVASMIIYKKKTRTICTGDAIPAADHSMIIAVPPRWQGLLGLS